MPGASFSPFPSEVLGITVEDGEDPPVCRLSGELDALNAPRLRALLLERGQDERGLVLDLSELQFIDSSGLGVLVGALKRYEAAGQGLTLRAPRPSVRRVLDMTGLTRAFSVED